MDEHIFVTLQMGVQREHLTLARNAQPDLLHCLREKARQFVEKSHPNQKSIVDKLLLFRHNYDSPNLLQLLQKSEGNGLNWELYLEITKV